MKIFAVYFPIARNNDRNFGVVKVISIGFIFVLSSYFYSKSLFDKLDYFIYLLRGIFFSLFVGSNIAGGMVGIELASRMLFFYFALEIILAIRKFNDGFSCKIGSVIILLSYGIAINVYTLLEQVE